MGLRFNPPPNWPPPPPGFVPPPRWQPDPSWPPPPPGWQVWLPDDDDVGAGEYQAGPYQAGGVPPRPADFARGAAGRGAPPGAVPRPDDPGTGGFAAGDFPAGDLAPGDFATGPAGFPARAGGFPGAPGDYPGRPGDYPGGPGEFGTGGPGGRDPFGGTTQIYPPRGRRGARQARARQLRLALFALAGLLVLVLIGVLVFHHGPSPAPSASGGRSPSAQPSGPASPASPAGPSSSAGTAGPAGGQGTQTKNVFSLKTGQCFENPPDTQTRLGITYVSAVPCTTPHNAQVFVQFPAAGNKYPGSAGLQRQADQGCHSRIAKNVQTSKITNTMTLRYLYPLASSWVGGHRSITCLIVDAKPDLKSSLLVAHPKG